MVRIGDASGCEYLSYSASLQATPADRLNNRRPPPPRQDPVEPVGCSPRRPASLDRPQSRSGLTETAPARRPTRPTRARFAPHSPAAGGTTHRHRAPARCSGREEARALPLFQNGAQRASRRSVRIATSSSLRRGRLRRRRRWPRHRGPRRGRRNEGRHRRRAGRLEHRELHLQREEARRPGARLRRDGVRDLQPERHLGEGQGGRPGRERPDLPGPRQRLAQPVRALPALHQGRPRAQRRGRPRAHNVKYWGEYYLDARHPPRARTRS